MRRSGSTSAARCSTRWPPPIAPAAARRADARSMPRRHPRLATAFLLLAISAALAACAPREQRGQLYALSTLVEITLVGRDAEEARADLAAVERELRRAERTFRA